MIAQWISAMLTGATTGREHVDREQHRVVAAWYAHRWRNDGRGILA